ncbi:hypothetical protein OAK21_06380 [Pseudomonadota bacterium]|nr:hypothetical protein [Pseudomonadota bacterium]
MLAIIHARMSSKRLPGKVLMPLGKRKILEIIHDRVSSASTIKQIIVATSTESSDDPIYEFCNSMNYNCHRGPLENLQLRMFEALNSVHKDCFVRICGDSPLIDPYIVDLAVNLFTQGNFDLTTNTQTRSYPKGQSVEVISKKVIEPGRHSNLNSWSTEHLCQGVYENPSYFSIINFSSGYNLGEFQMSVDTDLDYQRISKLFEKYSEVSDNWYETYKLLREIN